MGKFVISVVSDMDDSSTYGIFDTEEEAEKVLEQLPEHMYEGDYFFNIHEIQTKDDFLDSYSSGGDYGYAEKIYDDEVYENEIVDEYDYPLVSSEEWVKDKEKNQNKLIDFFLQTVPKNDTTWRTFPFKTKQECINYLNNLKNNGTLDEKEDFYMEYKSFGIGSTGYYSFENDSSMTENEFNEKYNDFRERIIAVADDDAADWTPEDFIRESQKSANDFLYGDNKTNAKTLDEIFEDDRNVPKSEFADYYEGKYFNAHYYYMMFNNPLLGEKEDQPFTSDENVAEISVRLGKEFRKDYQNKVRELAEEKGIPLEQLFDEEFLY